MSDLKREITFLPAYDKRHPDPAKNFGIHGVEMRWYVSGPGLTVQFVVYTNWMLSDVEGFDKSLPMLRNARDDCKGGLFCSPSPANLGYHSAAPLYEDHGKMDSCEFFPDGCYYDGSGLNAYPIFATLVREGSEEAWTALEAYWHETKERALKEQR